MMLIRFACAVLALAILTIVPPGGRSTAATNQVIEMPNGLKYTDTKTGGGVTATPDLKGLAPGQARVFKSGPFVGQTWTINAQGQPQQVK